MGDCNSIIQYKHEYVQIIQMIFEQKLTQIFEVVLYRTEILSRQDKTMTNYEKVEVLANTEIEKKLTRIAKYYQLQNMILGTNMT